MMSGYEQRRRLQGEIAIFRNTLFKRGWGSQTPNSDAYYQTLDRAAYKATDEGGILRPNIEEAFNERDDTLRQISPQVMVSLFERAVHYYALNHYDKEYYPVNFGPPNPVTEHNSYNLLKEIASNNRAPLNYGEFQQKLEMQVPISNEPERAIGIKVLSLLFPERFGSNPKILEPGCSLNLILKWLASSGMNTSAHVEVLKSDYETLDSELNKQFNAVLGARIAIGSSLGVDIFDTYRDLGIENWGVVCTVTPGEMINQPGRLETIRALTRFDPDKVRFLRADFADEEEMKNFPPSETYMRKTIRGVSMTRPFNTEMFDTALISTVEYMLRKERREPFHKHKNQYTKADGIDVEQEFARPASYNSGQLNFEDDIYARKFLYRTMFMDKLNTDAGWQVAFTWETGRCQRVVINEMAKIVVGSELVGIKDRLMEW